MSFHPVLLEGAVVRLEPVTEAHLAELEAAALRAPQVFRHIPYCMDSPDAVRRRFRAAVALNTSGDGVYFAHRHRASGEVIGGTGIRVVDPAVISLEIGMTWIVPEWQRTGVNTEAKLLQLTHCFEALSVARVEFKTDVLNERSRAAIARLGAREEGTMRKHMRREDGSLRDSVLFSIIAADWPDVKARLERLRARH